ncbi:MAG TPA: SAM-dependent chlorinase/fluorinase [Pyrinomonadaceae bacterium]|jgi:S-adenosylmethionine hydrolase|nr:SAM-dependent chlorinase/fluorinase [Pyrinomonadaceae bacterium]
MFVTFLTDFGTTDYFVGAMKGALLAVCPEAHIIDITHDVPAHDIKAGAFTLFAAHETFPPGTIHVAVVDPGVGSARRPILAVSGGHFFVGPDNGLFTHIYERRLSAQVFHLTNEKFFRPSQSTTFHGRDVFAPVAGALANGVAPASLGEAITDYYQFPLPKPKRLDDGTLEASIIHIDRFGNCITNISPNDLPDAVHGGMRLDINSHEVRSVRQFFAEAEGAGGELFAVWGSAGFLEIAVYCGSAASVLDARRGQKLRVTSD